MAMARIWSQAVMAKTATASSATDGWIFVNRERIEASDKWLLDEPLHGEAVRLYVSDDHMGNFIDGIRTRKRPICDVEVGYRSVTVCHLGAIALRLGIPLDWDPRAERFVGPRADKGNAMISREMRLTVAIGNLSLLGALLGSRTKFARSSQNGLALSRRKLARASRVSRAPSNPRASRSKALRASGVPIFSITAIARRRRRVSP